MARSLVLVTVDCFRADHAGFLGYKKNTTPFLDSLAHSSTIFSNAMVAGAPTYYSLPAIMASRHPLGLGRDVIGLAPGESTLATVLHDAGYATGAFLAGNPYLSPGFGYDAGFEVFRDFLKVSNSSDAGNSFSRKSRVNSYLAEACHSFGPVGKLYDELYFRYCQSASPVAPSLDAMRRFPSADILVNEACGWLENINTGPFFLWLHLMDPHSPYYPKEEALRWMGGHAGAEDARYANSYWNRGDLSVKRLLGNRDQIIELYDSGIRWVDAQVERLVEYLRSKMMWEDCMFAVTADHGEEFLEHGGRNHSPANLSEELIHVPLLLHHAGQQVAEKYDETFSLVDLAPTLLNAIDITAPESFRGRSVKEGADGEGALGQAAIIESVGTCKNPMEGAQRVGPRMLAVRESIYKLVIDFGRSSEELFNLQEDPGEMHSLPPGAEKSVRRRLLELAQKHVAHSLSSRDSTQRLDAQLRDIRLENMKSIVSIAA